MRRALPPLRERTPIVGIEAVVAGRRRRLWLKLEGANRGRSLKDRTARSLVAALERDGRLLRGSVLVESTSGNLGVALARIARRRGYRFVAVVDPKTTPENIASLRRLGATVELVEDPDETGGYLLSRLARVAELCASSERFVWPNQYANPANPAAHEHGTAPEILHQLRGRVDGVVVPVSTGGTLAGISRFFRRASPRTRILAVDARGSVALVGSPGRRLLTGIGASRRSLFVSRADYDEAFLVDDSTAFAHCRALAATASLRVGGSSGAALAAAIRYLADEPDCERLVCICADGGDGYASTIYDDRWLHRNGIELEPELLLPAGSYARITRGAAARA